MVSLHMAGERPNPERFEAEDGKNDCAPGIGLLTLIARALPGFAGPSNWIFSC
jgi:hypothetical protein